MVKVDKRRTSTYCDCWGRLEYDYEYVVLDENGNEIYKSKDDPTELINILANKNKQ